MNLYQAAYARVPWPLQNAIVSASGYVKNRRRYGHIYQQERAFLVAFDGWPLERKTAWAQKRLSNLLRHAISQSPYYSEVLSEKQIAKYSLSGDMSALPILDKETLRKNADALFTLSPRDGVMGLTGGTTGKSLRVLFTPADVQRRMAMIEHFRTRVGFNSCGMRRATFSGNHLVSKHSEPFWRYNLPSRQLLLSSYHLGPDTLANYVKALQKYRPVAIDGFFSKWSMLASYAQRYDVRLPESVQYVFPTSETVTESGRELLEDAFGARVFDQYSSSEGAPFFTECIHGTKHVDLATGIFEDDPEFPGQTLVTSFHTFGTPLIRYRIGDSIELGPDVACECGIESPTVASINGRGSDYVIAGDGSVITSANFANILKRAPQSVIAAQATQDYVGVVRLLLQVDATRFTTASERKLYNAAVGVLGATTQIHIDIVGEIPVAASGKTRLIVNNLDPSLISQYLNGSRDATPE